MVLIHIHTSYSSNIPYVINPHVSTPACNVPIKCPSPRHTPPHSSLPDSISAEYTKSILLLFGDVTRAHSRYSLNA